jgi:hypothetical protein
MAGVDHVVEEALRIRQEMLPFETSAGLGESQKNERPSEIRFLSDTHEPLFYFFFRRNQPSMAILDPEVFHHRYDLEATPLIEISQ